MNPGILLIVSFFTLLAFGIPIAFGIGLSSVFTLLFAYDKPLMLISQRLVTGTNKFALMAIPFFILVGILMRKSEISANLVDLASSLVGFIRGGLSMAVVLASMVFAAVSGSGPATVAAIGGITIPEMQKRGYSKEFSTGIATSAGALGPIIPPSIPMIIYGVTAEVSITKLFLGGIGAGLLLGAILMILSYFKARREGVPRIGHAPSGKEVFVKLWKAKWALGAPVIILGGIYGGIFTPTEAGAVGSAYVILAGFLTKGLNFKKLKDGLLESAELSAVVMFVIGNAFLFGWLITSIQIPQMVSNSILAITTNKIILLLLLNLLLLVVGALMDTVAAIIILVPVLMPIYYSVGVDPIHLGLIVVVNLVIGYLTPPVGYNLYVGASISGLSFEKTSKSVLIFLVGSLIGLALLTYIPAISLFFPGLLS